MKIGIDGIGVVGGFGCGLHDLENALIQGKTEPGEVSVNTAGKTVRMPAFLADTSELARFMNKKAMRRIDHFTKMALLACHLAMEDSGARKTTGRRGLIVATGYGAMRTTFEFLDSAINDGDTCSSPIKFSNSIHNAAAAHISIFLGETGPGLSISQFEMSIPSAFLTAIRWLDQGRVDSVVVGGVDEYCDVLGYCHYRREDRKNTPDLKNAPGEGAAFFLLSGDGAGRHGSIQDVQMGTGEPNLPKDAFLFIRPDIGRAGLESSCSGSKIANYEHIYGNTPSGMGFDIAMASLSIKRDIVQARQIHCLGFGPGGKFGMVLVGE